jgi:CubicO group peptidase (beta-lactamase class C family)
LFLVCPLWSSLRADELDDFILAEMKRHHIPGLSLAIIQDGRIVKATGYGVIENGSGTRVTPSTLFQAGSISKSVAALGALYLVQKGMLSLDEDVNGKLVSWKVPENEFTREKKVTLGYLLSHRAGLTVHGFPGYAMGEPVPSLLQVLNGDKPANTDPVRVEAVPGSRWRYSGGGYTVMQQMIVDVTGKPYPAFMQEAVLAPMGMHSSTFEQPLGDAWAKAAATGHYPGPSNVKGRWHVYPEMAAAGLWTTASDLARFALGIQQSLAGKSNPVISVEMTRQMLTGRENNYGLGVGVEGNGDQLRFSHGGRDEGFDAMLVAYAETGQGAVIMINANDDSLLVSRILQFIARQYRWPEEIADRQD